MGRGSLVLVDAADLIDSMQIAAALSFEAFAANLSVIHPAAARARPHSGVVTAMSRLRDLLEDSSLWHPGAARNLQDPLSIRCVPQTHGALYDALSVARGLMEIELNSAADNPLVLVDEGVIVSVGNFDVTSLAMAFDYIRLGIAHAAQVANERVQKLLWQHFSGLPTGLAQSDGPTGGLRPLGRSFAALASEARFLANPVSLDYRGQLAEGVEDHASMAPLCRQHHLGAGQPGAPPRRAGADRRGAGHRPAGRPGAAGRPEPRRAYSLVREYAEHPQRRDRVERRRRGAGHAGRRRRPGPPRGPRRRRAPGAVRARAPGDLGAAGHAVRGAGARRRAPAPHRPPAGGPDRGRAGHRGGDADEHRLPAARRARAAWPDPARARQHGRAGDAARRPGPHRRGGSARADRRAGGGGDGGAVRGGGGDGDPHRPVRAGGDRAPRRGGRAPLGAPLLHAVPPGADAPGRVRQDPGRVPGAG